MKVRIHPRPAKRYLASAYPPIEPNTSEMKVPALARNSELSTYRQKLTGPCTVCLSAKSVRKLSRLIVALEIFATGGRKLYSFSTDLSLNDAHSSHTNG